MGYISRDRYYMAVRNRSNYNYPNGQDYSLERASIILKMCKEEDEKKR